MGCFDTINNVPKQFDDQVKCWDCTLSYYDIGSNVPSLGEFKDYAILLNKIDKKDKQDCFVIVKDMTIESIATDEPKCILIIDKWGHPLRYIEG